MRRLLGFLTLWRGPEVLAEYFPAVDPNQTWEGPHLQPWEPLRATATSVTLTWTPAWNPWCAISAYELEARRPIGRWERLANLEGLQHREADMWEEGDGEEWPGDEEWTPWVLAYRGQGRAFAYGIPTGTGYAAQFRVRACGPRDADGCSGWSAVQTAHVVLSAAVDKINFYFRGTGKNAPDYTIIEVNRQPIYRRRDETGLVLAVFSRHDFSLMWLRTYDTHRDRAAAVTMSKDMRKYDHRYFVVVASTIAWEWHAPRTLVHTMEYCGAYHFGQWAHIFAEQPHYESLKSDLQQTASQSEFGHPYVFIGIPGIGTGMGWESLMYNTGQYLPHRDLNSQKAIIRGFAYYDYVARIYRLQDVQATKADLYLRNNPPLPETLHNPAPPSTEGGRWHIEGVAPDDPTVQDLIQQAPIYKPYVGTLQTQIAKLIEANETVPPYNFAFLIVSVAGVVKVDPRPRQFWVTELERIWSGPSARYSIHDGSLLNAGIELRDRSCREFVYHGYTASSPELCGSNFEDCCPTIDTPGLLALSCNIGVSPTLCRNSSVLQLQNWTALHTAQHPFHFRVIHGQIINADSFGTIENHGADRLGPDLRAGQTST